MQFPPAPRRPHHTSPLWCDSIINASADGESYHNTPKGIPKSDMSTRLISVFWCPQKVFLFTSIFAPNEHQSFKNCYRVTGNEPQEEAREHDTTDLLCDND